MDPDLRRTAEAARGFMPPEEGIALYEAAAELAPDGAYLEVGSYCGKSAVYLGAGAARHGRRTSCRRSTGESRPARCSGASGCSRPARPAPPPEGKTGRCRNR